MLSPSINFNNSFRIAAKYIVRKIIYSRLEQNRVNTVTSLSPPKCFHWDSSFIRSISILWFHFTINSQKDYWHECQQPNWSFALAPKNARSYTTQKSTNSRYQTDRNGRNNHCEKIEFQRRKQIDWVKQSGFGKILNIWNLTQNRYEKQCHRHAIW